MVTKVRGAVITDRLYVPAKYLDRAKLDKHLHVRLYKEQTCGRCPIKIDRHADECERCPAFIGEMQMWHERTVKGKDYIALPPGDIDRLQLLFDIELVDVDDRRADLKLSFKLKFIGKLFDGSTINGRKTVNQKELVDKWLKKKMGTIISPPRSGKTVCGSYAICKINSPTLILAAQEDWLIGFYDTFCGNKKRGKKAMVNIRELREQTGRPIIGIVKKIKDLEKYDIALCNYQKLIRKESAVKRLEKYVNDKKIMLVVDESHMASSPAFCKLIGRLKCKYRLALTATFDRKDGKSILGKNFLGPVVAKAVVQSLTPNISVIETGFTSKYQHKVWVYAMKALADSQPRTAMIIKMLFEDYDSGHRGIIIPVDFKKQAWALAQEINKQAAKRGFEGKFAEIFQSGCNRKQILLDVDSGKVPVIIAIRSMIKMGIDVATPSMIYIVVPMSAAPPPTGAPMFYQLSNRVCSFAPNKKQPEIKIFVDGMGASSGCFRSLWNCEIKPNLVNKSNGDKPRYAMSDHEKLRASMIANSRKYAPINPIGEYWSSEKILKKLGKMDDKGSLFGGGLSGRRGN